MYHFGFKLHRVKNKWKSWILLRDGKITVEIGYEYIRISTISTSVHATVTELSTLAGCEFNAVKRFNETFWNFWIYLKIYYGIYHIFYGKMYIRFIKMYWKMSIFDTC